MAIEPVSTEITGTRKIVILSLVGLVIVMSLIGTFNPSAREFITGTVKGVLTFIPAIVK